MSIDDERDKLLDEAIDVAETAFRLLVKCREMHEGELVDGAIDQAIRESFDRKVKTAEKLTVEMVHNISDHMDKEALSGLHRDMHIVRNPYGHSADSVKASALFLSDTVERQANTIKKQHEALVRFNNAFLKLRHGSGFDLFGDLCANCLIKKDYSSDHLPQCYFYVIPKFSEEEE